MASFNKVIMLGNLTRDPEMKFLPSGTPVAEFGIAMNRKWMDQATNQPREAVTFVDCKAMGRQAEVLSQHMRKGSPLFVEGRLDYRQWEGPDGTKRSKLEVFVENFQFIGPPRDQQGGEPASPCEVVPLAPDRRSGATEGMDEPAGQPDRRPGRRAVLRFPSGGASGFAVTPVQAALAAVRQGGKAASFPLRDRGIPL